MKLFERGAELSLQGDGASRFVPWVIALKVYFAALAIAGGLGLQGAVGTWDAGARAAVTLPAADGAEDEPPSVAAVLAVLGETEGIAAARVVPESEIAELLEPWLGEGGMVDGLPIPTLIDVEPVSGAWVDWPGLEARLQVMDNRVELLTGKMWLGRLVDFARTIQAIAVAVVVLVVAATAATVALVTRAGLEARDDLVELLHLIGARDAYIARQFQMHAARLALNGGVVGVAFAALTVAIFWLMSGPMETLLLPRIDIEPAMLAAFVVLPLVTAVIAMITARRTVMRALMRLP